MLLSVKCEFSSKKMSIAMSVLVCAVSPGRRYGPYIHEVGPLVEAVFRYAPCRHASCAGI